METKIRGDRAREILDRLLFNGAIHTETIGYAGDFVDALEFRPGGSYLFS